MTHIEIYNTTRRDGELAPGAAVSPQQKLELAISLCALGADTIEARFPVASAADARAVASVVCQVRGARMPDAKMRMLVSQLP